MDVLIDTNVIIDTVQEREPFCSDAKAVLASCIKKSVSGFVSAHSLCDIFYILRKDMSVEARLSLVGGLCKYLTVISERQNDFESITEDKETKDLEDSLQMLCAENYQLDYIVTRNIRDFVRSKVKAIEPRAFLNLLGNH